MYGYNICIMLLQLTPTPYGNVVFYDWSMHVTMGPNLCRTFCSRYYVHSFLDLYKNTHFT